MVMNMTSGATQEERKHPPTQAYQHLSSFPFVPHLQGKRRNPENGYVMVRSMNPYKSISGKPGTFRSRMQLHVFLRKNMLAYHATREELRSRESCARRLSILDTGLAWERLSKIARYMQAKGSGRYTASSSVKANLPPGKTDLYPNQKKLTCIRSTDV